MLRKLSYFIIFVGLVIYVSSCNEGPNKADINKAEEKRWDQFNKDAIEMAIKYNAIYGWEDKIFSYFLYSIDLEDILTPKDGCPVLIKVAFVMDIVRLNNKYNVLFDGRIHGRRVSIQLEATPDQVEALKKHRREYVAIIAQISSVHNMMYVNNEDEWSNRFIVDGRCIDLLFFSDIKTP
jgi:hypothetical protein